MKDDRDDVRENGTNGEDRKGTISVTMRIHNLAVLIPPSFNGYSSRP
jgi:hypothetical protein